MSLSDDDNADLCDVCRSLNIDMDNFIVGPPRQRARRRTPARFALITSTALVRLGTFEEISERESQQGCGFCRLVLASARTSPLLKSTKCEPPPSATCDMRWEVDGRRMGATKHAGSYEDRQRGPGALTRRIRLHWDHDSIEDAYLVAVAEEKYLATSSDAHHAWSSESLFLGRRTDFNSFNQARLNSWTDLCKLHHPHPCDDWFAMDTPQKFQNMLKHSYFGVIDVVNMQLVQLPTYATPQGFRHYSYAALSYVWGNDETTFRTRKNNVTLLRMHGGLEKYMPQLPPVIRDAIDLVRRLDLQFIWIDALCIIQNSENSWRLNAYNMDVIYGNAELTIVAADQDKFGAPTGLKAADLSADSDTQTTAKCGDDIELMLIRTPESYIKASTWNTRAWTFQERLMSRRCLVFVEGRVFFQCRSTGMSEDIYADRDGTGWSLDLVDAPMRTFKQTSERSFWVYMAVAQLYSSRQLTKAKDILAAFWGITTHMKRVMRAPFVFGLPSSHFDLAILWQHVGPAARREPKTAKEMLEYGEHRFPTWSWMGWTGTSITYSHDTLGDCLDNTSEWLTNHTWIRWYIRDGTGDLRPLWDGCSWRTDESKDVTWQGYGYNRTSGGQIPTAFTERRKIHHSLDSGEFLDMYDRRIVERPGSPLRASTDSYIDPERDEHEVRAHLKVIRPSNYRAEGYAQWKRDLRPEDSVTQAPDHHDSVAEGASGVSRDAQSQQHNEPPPPPPPKYDAEDDFYETRSQQQQRPKQQLNRRVTWEDHVSPRQNVANGEFEARNMDEMGPPPRALSNRFGSRSIVPEREREILLTTNSSNFSRVGLKPKYDDMFMPDENVQPGQTESEPKFFISPNEYPYPPVIHPYNRDLDSDRAPLMPLLQFWTWYAQLNIATRPEVKQAEANLQEGLQRCDIADDNGDWCGSIVLQSKWVDKCKNARQEFIAISEAKAFSMQECEAWTYYIPKERHESEWDVFYVLLIERKDEQWERVGLGKVFKEAFMPAARWREIMLG